MLLLVLLLLVRQGEAFSLIRYGTTTRLISPEKKITSKSSALFAGDDGFSTYLSSGFNGNDDRDEDSTFNLSYCPPSEDENCEIAYRERVQGNKIVLTSPATGQVMLTHTRKDYGGQRPKVLILLRQGDSSLISFLLSILPSLAGKVKVYVEREVMATLTHDHDVLALYGDDCISPYVSCAASDFGSLSSSTIPSSYGDVPYDTVPSPLTPPVNDEVSPQPDLVCTVGGDGLLMHASTLFPKACPPILCVAGGSLGFLTPFCKSECAEGILWGVGLGRSQVLGSESPPSTPRNSPVSELGFDEIEDVELLPSRPSLPDPTFEPSSVFATPSLKLSLRIRLECTVLSNSNSVRCRFPVLNEVVIDRGSSSFLTSLEAYVDGSHLATVAADGVIVATPTGSTAYSMAAGGSVVHPSVPCMLFTAVAPHVMGTRPMVFPDHCTLQIRVPEDSRADAAVSFDGKYRRLLRRGERVVIRVGMYPVPTINKRDHSVDWLEGLRKSFGFNYRVGQRSLFDDGEEESY
jgi:NAD+ kinase